MDDVYIVTASELLENRVRPMQWLVEGLIPYEGFTLLYGPKASYKSSTVLDIACHVARGRPWCGHETSQASVLFVMGEGFGPAKSVLRAWHQREASKGETHEEAAEVGLRSGPVDITDPDSVETLIDECRGTWDFVVLDTLSRCMPGKDENSSAQMGAAVAGIDLLQRNVNGGVIAIHHTGKDGRDPRGHSNLPCAADAVISCRAKGTQIRVKADHQREGPGGLEVSLLPTIHTVAEGVTAVLVEPSEGRVAESSEPIRRDGDEAVRETLAAGPLQWGQLEAKSGVRGGTLTRALARLIQSGTVRKEGKKYQIVS